MRLSRGSYFFSKDAQAAITSSFKGRVVGSCSSGLDVTTPSHPASDTASSYCTHLPEFPESSAYDSSVFHGATSDDRREPINEDDIVIVVMGLTGSGKTSFVRTASEGADVAINHDLRPQIRSVRPIRCSSTDGLRNVVLVDTPGFDNMILSEFQVLTIIASWLRETYQNNIKPAGVLYLHRISDVRLAGTSHRMLAVFKELCGESHLRNVVLVTTMWDELQDESVGLQREEELTSNFWRDMMSRGSRTCRFQGNHKSAWEIINILDLNGSRRRCSPLDIQKEMVDRSLPLDETSAAKTLARFLLVPVGKLKMVLKKLLSGRR